MFAWSQKEEWTSSWYLNEVFIGLYTVCFDNMSWREIAPNHILLFSPSFLVLKRKPKMIVCQNVLGVPPIHCKFTKNKLGKLSVGSCQCGSGILELAPVFKGLNAQGDIYMKDARYGAPPTRVHCEQPVTELFVCMYQIWDWICIRHSRWLSDTAVWIPV